MSEIKNIDLIKHLLTENQLLDLGVGAAIHKHNSRIEFKILEVKEDEISIRVTQGESPAENNLSSKQLGNRAKELFKYFLPNKTIHVRSIPYHVPKVDEVNIGWIQSRMTSKGMTQKSMVEETGIEKEKIQSWLNGLQPMSQEVKALFWYMLR